MQSLLVPFSSPLTAPSNSMHSLCQQGAVCNWLPSPRYCIQSLYLEESLPLHQSDPYLKASNLPYISLINFEFPAFITSPLETSLQIVYYSFIVSSLQHRCHPAKSPALWRTLVWENGANSMCGSLCPSPKAAVAESHIFLRTILDNVSHPVVATLTEVSFKLFHIQN